MSSRDRMRRKTDAAPIGLIDTVAGRYLQANSGATQHLEPGTPERIQQWLAIRQREVGR